MVGENGRDLHYLLGLPRSGTTLLSVLLARHPAVAAPSEPWLMLALESLGTVGARHPAEVYLLGEGVADFVRGLDAPRAAAAAARSLYNQRLAADGRSVFIDKTPRYWSITDFLAAAFPEAGFLWLLRNPMAVAASLKKTWGFAPLGPVEAGQNEFMRLDLMLGVRHLKDFAARHPGVHRIRYEALVADETGVMAGVFAALGLDPADATGAFDPARARPAAAAMGDRKILETRGVHADAVETWKTDLTLPEMQAVFDGLGRELFEELGYGATVGALLELGVVDRGPDATAAVVDDLERRLARRRRDLHRATRFDPVDGWPFTLREAEDLAHADPTRVIQTDYRLTELHESLDAHKEMIRRLDREHAARIEDHRQMVENRDRTIEARERSIHELQEMIGRLDREHAAAIEELRTTIADRDRTVEARERSIREHQEMVWDLEARLARLQASADALRDWAGALRDWAEAVTTSRSGRLLASLGRLHPPPLRDDEAVSTSCSSSPA